jgi:ADP-glucose pyrophosphorylase
VKIGKGSVVKDSIIFADTTIGEGCHIARSILDENVLVEANVTIGGDEKIAVVAADVKLGTGITIDAGEMVERDRK